MGEGEGVVDIVSADLGAAESGEIGAGTEFFADIFGQRSDVGAGATVDSDFKFWVVVI